MRAMPRPRLLVWIGGVPDAELLWPLLGRVAERGRIDVDARVYARRLRADRRLASAYESGALVPRWSGKLRMRLFFGGDLARADGVAGLNDPARDRSGAMLRGHALTRRGVPFAFVQHGAVQTGINYPDRRPLPNHAAERLLLWDRPDGPLAGDDPRIRLIGFPKRRFLPALRPPREIAEWRARHARVALICHSFRWPGRYGPDAAGSFLDTIETLARTRPDTGFILRGHRGRTNRRSEAREAALATAFPNVIRSQRGRGPLAGATIQDAVDLTDLVITPASTVALDAAYMDRPVAILADGVTAMPELPSVFDAGSMMAFLDGALPDGGGSRALCRRYGRIDDNLDRAAAALEDWLGG